MAWCDISAFSYASLPRPKFSICTIGGTWTVRPPPKPCRTLCMLSYFPCNWQSSMLSLWRFQLFTFSLPFYKNIFPRTGREATSYREFVRGFRLSNGWLADWVKQVPHNRVEKLRLWQVVSEPNWLIDDKTETCRRRIHRARPRKTD